MTPLNTVATANITRGILAHPAQRMRDNISHGLCQQAETMNLFRHWPRTTRRQVLLLPWLTCVPRYLEDGSSFDWSGPSNLNIFKSLLAIQVSSI